MAGPSLGTTGYIRSEDPKEYSLSRTISFVPGRYREGEREQRVRGYEEERTKKRTPRRLVTLYEVEGWTVKWPLSLETSLKLRRGSL